ncbi:MAG TPA: hypothetical protein VFX02_00720 [Gammaproteobacteria bacterium]|nr:hypothetical protein [Gammaproteobacteria bacterium]
MKRYLPIKFLQGLLFLGFILFKLAITPAMTPEKDIPLPITADHIRLVALGEPPLAAKLVAFWLLTVDVQAGNWLRLEELNYPNLTGWLETIQELDPWSEYPGMVASGVFIDVKDSQRIRWIIDFVLRNFEQAPERRWRWLAQCAVLAKYRLHDRPLALRLASALRTHTRPGALPAWARDMEFLLLQEIGEYETARQVILGILQSGEALEPREQAFLLQRLRELESDLSGRYVE